MSDKLRVWSDIYLVIHRHSIASKSKGHVFGRYGTNLVLRCLKFKVGAKYYLQHRANLHTPGSHLHQMDLGNSPCKGNPRQQLYYC